MQHEHEDGASWSDSEPAGEQAVEPVTCNAADQAVQSQEELRDGPTDITDAQEAWDTIQHCSVIVGMHPDQVATSCSYAMHAQACAVAWIMHFAVNTMYGLSRGMLIVQQWL